jgi:antitoxin (DNA-binding transcriptional repressor) of toxin-antitoxin stability system
MKSVGVKELKSHLSQYLKLVKNGEVVIVTDHKKMVAEIRQPTNVSTDDNRNQKIEAYLDNLQGEGKLNRATRFRSLIDSFQSIGKMTTNSKWKNIYSKLRDNRY